MALTNETLKALTLKIMDATRTMIEGRGLGDVKFRISPDGSVGAVFVQAFPRQAGGEHMALMLAISERQQPVTEAMDQFVSWVESAQR